MATGVEIVGYARTPIGGFVGELSSLSAPDLGAHALSSALGRAAVDPGDIDELLMGCVLPAGVGQAPARQAGLGAGLPDDVPACTINKVCGSGMKAVALGFDLIRAGTVRMVAAGGMESMSNAPRLVRGTRTGIRMGDCEMEDHMVIDGLADAYDGHAIMGVFAEECADRYGFGRTEQDDYALRSLERAQAAQASGAFRTELAPLAIIAGKAEVTVSSDEGPRRARAERIGTLPPAFRDGGTVTAANAASISDGAAALILGAATGRQGRRARIVGYAGHAQVPSLYTTAPVFAVNKLLARVGWSARDVDLWEVNEAFAVVALAFLRETGVPHERLNVNGGACALGHPIGASGARIIVTLVAALEDRDLTRGVAAICIGGGEAMAIAIERRPGRLNAKEKP